MLNPSPRSARASAILISWQILVFAFIGAPFTPRASAAPNPAAQPLISYWDTQRRGANCGNKSLTPDYFTAAKQAGVEFLRIFPNKWPTEARDFLIGDADDYTGLIPADLALLRATLDQADAAGLKVVLTISSLPGARWRQQNEGKPDHRLWRQPRYLEQSARLWHDLAFALRAHPALVGYDILNEPHPERATGFDDEITGDFAAWYAGVKGTPADLNAFNRAIVAAIRAVDPAVPIILESGMWASPRAFAYLEPIENDPAILYSFHMYEPFRYTKRDINQGRFTYPGTIETHDGPNGSWEWNRARIAEYLQPIAAWSAAHNVPPSRIYVGEFGVNRMNAGAAAYIEDVIGVLNDDAWHWSFYAFREDTWPGMDYELGIRAIPDEYWSALDRGETPPPPPRQGGEVWDVLKNAMVAPRPHD